MAFEESRKLRGLGSCWLTLIPSIFGSSFLPCRPFAPQTARAGHCRNTYGGVGAWMGLASCRGSAVSPLRAGGWWGQRAQKYFVTEDAVIGFAGVSARVKVLL